MAIQDYFENFVYISEIKTEDGYGGFVTEYVESGSLKASVFSTTRQELLVSEQKNGVAGYMITVSKSTPLTYNQLLKRVSDNKCFRVITDPNDFMTPKKARIQLKQAELEPIELPTGGDIYV